MTRKILFLSHSFSPDIGGIEVISEVLALAFTKRGYEVHVITWSKNDCQDHYPYKIIRNPGLKTLLSEHKWADLVFENNICLRLSWPAILFKNLSIVTLQTWMTRKNGKISYKDKLKQRWLNRADRVIACSNAIRDRCCPDSLVIQNPYKEKVFRKDPIIDKSKEFIFLGRMVTDKGAELAIRAFSEIINNRKNGSRIKFSMVGDGPEKKKLEKLSIDMGLQKNIHFTGPLKGKRLVECLNKHRFILVPSLWEEPFGIVVLEGLACGCVPIASDGGGLPDATGDTGIIFKRGDRKDLEKSMNLLLDNADLENELRSRAESHLRLHRSSTVSQKYINVIEETFRKRQISDLQEISA